MEVELRRRREAPRLAGPDPGRRRGPGRRGFTLIETLIAGALLLLIAVGVIPLFTQSLANNLAGADSSTAVNTARSQTEELFQMPFNSAPLTLVSGTELVTESYFSYADQAWKPGPEPPGGTDPALWLRTSTIRQYSVLALEDDLVDPSEALDAAADPGQVHFKEIESEIVGTRTGGPLGPSRRVTVRLLKSQ